MARVVLLFLVAVSLLPADTIRLKGGGRISNCVVITPGEPLYKVEILYGAGKKEILIHSDRIAFIDYKPMDDSIPTMISGVRSLSDLADSPGSISIVIPGKTHTLPEGTQINWGHVPMTLLGLYMSWQTFDSAKTMKDLGASGGTVDEIKKSGFIYLALSLWNGYYIFEKSPDNEKGK